MKRQPGWDLVIFSSAIWVVQWYEAKERYLLVRVMALSVRSMR